MILAWGQQLRVDANGASKTTLLRALSRLLSSRRGTIVFDGEVIDRAGPHEMARRGLVPVPQGRMIIPGLTVEANLRIGVNRVADLKPAEIERMLEGKYQRFPVLKSRRAVLGTSLSGGPTSGRRCSPIPRSRRRKDNS